MINAGEATFNRRAASVTANGSSGSFVILREMDLVDRIGRRWPGNGLRTPEAPSSCFLRLHQSSIWERRKRRFLSFLWHQSSHETIATSWPPAEINLHTSKSNPTRGLHLRRFLGRSLRLFGIIQ